MQRPGCTWRVQGRVIPAFYSPLAMSLRSLAIVLPLYYSTILTSTCATISTDIPSYQAIHGHMPLQMSRKLWDCGSEQQSAFKPRALQNDY